MATEEKTFTIYPTENLNLATTLLCHEGIMLEQVIAQSLPEHLKKQGRMPRCTWHIASADEAMLQGLVDQHERQPEGLQVGTKKYEDVRANTVVKGMIEAQRSLANTEGDE